MRYFFDTEFLEDGETIELISIGIVNEAGRKYYAVVDDHRLFGRAWEENEWVRDNVLCHLPTTEPREFVRRDGSRFFRPDLLRTHSLVKPRQHIAEDIVRFVGEMPEFWAYYADYDWVVLCQLYGRMIDLPETWPMYCRDLKQELDRCLAFAEIALPPDPSNAHNALADAEWNAALYDALSEHITRF